MLYTVLGNSTIFGATFPVLPEFQVYHTVGSRGSTYATGAIGVSLHLFDDTSGTERYLHVLALSIPEKTVAWKSKYGPMYLLNGHAHTEPTELRVKEKFWSEATSPLKKFPFSLSRLLFGGLNA